MKKFIIIYSVGGMDFHETMEWSSDLNNEIFLALKIEEIDKRVTGNDFKIVWVGLATEIKVIETPRSFRVAL